MDNPIEELIQNAIDTNYNAANNSFNTAINDKISQVMNLERERLANHFYNGASSETNEDDNEVPEQSAEASEGSEEDDIDSQAEVSDEQEEDEYEDIDLDDITDDEMEDALDEVEEEE